MNHVGICERVEPGYVTTIDGNTGSDEANGGTVARKRRSLNYVGGAAGPAYEDVASADEAGPAAPTGSTQSPVAAKSSATGGQRLYRYVAEMPEWARQAAAKAIRRGILRMDESGAVGVWESSLQSLVWLERLGLLEPGENQT